MINWDEDNYDEEMTIPFDEMPTLENKTREGNDLICRVYYAMTWRKN